MAGLFYPAGFTNQITALGSRYVPPPSRTRVLDFTNGVVLLEGGNLEARTTNVVTLEPRARLRVIGPNSNHLALVLDAKTGRFRGSFLNPQTHKRDTLRGVLLPKQNIGAGYFLGTNQSGAVYLGLPEN